MRRPSTAKRPTGLGLTLILGATLALLTGAFAQEFPFERELLLDAAPMRGSGQVIVAGDKITIIPGTMRPAQCGPEQTRGDEEILANLMQVTNWRREGDVLILVGPTPLRFRSATN